MWQPLMSEAVVTVFYQMLPPLHSCMMKAVSEYPTRNVPNFRMAFYLALTHPIPYNHPVAHLLTSQSRFGIADDIRGPTKCMDCLHDRL